MKFLVDMPLSPSLARWLTEHGHPSVHASEIGLDTASDIEIIQSADAESRAIITADLDYPRLLALTGAKQPSLVLFRGGTWGDSDVISRMESLLSSIPESEFDQSIFVVDRTRIRRHRLPVRR